MLTRLRRAGSVVVSAIAVGLLVLAWPAALGGQMTWVMVSGTSMEPAYSTGDMVLMHRGGSWEVGDVVVYGLDGIDAEGASSAAARIMHRLVSGNESEGWTAQGDNRPYADPWTVPDHAIQGVELMTIPGAGIVVSWMRAPIVLAVSAGLLVFWAVMAGPRRESTPHT